MAIRFDLTSDEQWVIVSVNEDPFSTNKKPLVIGIEREAFDAILRDDPRPPEILLDLIAQRAIRRMPVPNSPDGRRLITPYNLSVVWP